jgi:hypothetical protein
MVKGTNPIGSYPQSTMPGLASPYPRKQLSMQTVLHRRHVSNSLDLLGKREDELQDEFKLNKGELKGHLSILCLVQSGDPVPARLKPHLIEIWEVIHEVTKEDQMLASAVLRNDTEIHLTAKSNHHKLRPLVQWCKRYRYTVHLHPAQALRRSQRNRSAPAPALRRSQRIISSRNQ